MILDRLTWSDSFERFVASKYPSEKRFGLEGGETLIPGMKALVSRCATRGVEGVGLFTLVLYRLTDLLILVSNRLLSACLIVVV